MTISEAPSKEIISVDQALQKAISHAQTGHHEEMLATCRKIIESHSDNIDVLLNVGVLLLNFGFLTHARDYLTRGQILAPNDFRLLLNIANLDHDAGDHPESRRQYDALLELLPNSPVVRRNALVSLEYDPHVSDSERLEQAKKWGKWAMAKAGGVRSRPMLRPLAARPLRIGYLSADFCQHTVGLFVKDVIASHDHDRFMVFAYSAGQVTDWVTSAIGKACTFRDVSAMNDIALAERIRQDDIDVLVDLSGHTAGSRLTVFAYRTAPVQVSWLGYFATTGLPCIDAVILDEWHAPPDTETHFVEPIIRLPMGRFCYHPVPWAPAEVAPQPCMQNGYITFGCFNNTAKLNSYGVRLLLMPIREWQHKLT